MKNIKKLLSLFLIFNIILIFLAGCSNSTSENTGSTVSEIKKISVYTSFYAMYDFANKIGSDHIKLTNLVPAGTEPHDWEPTPKDMAEMQNADVLIYNGAGMESWIDTVLNSLESNKHLVVVNASQNLKLIKSPDQSEDLQYDPHVWLDPMLAKQEMEVIKNSFVKADPANKDYYEKNYAANAQKLNELDQEYKLATASFSKKDIVVAHQAFSYLCNAYGLKQISIEGLMADSEPSPNRMAEIINLVKTKDLKYIFFEELVSPKVAQTIAHETGASTAVLNPLEGLEESDIQAGKDYFSVMRENLETLTKALK